MTLTRLLDQCDFMLALAPEDEPPSVTLERLRQTIIEDFGGDVRALQVVDG